MVKNIWDRVLRAFVVVILIVSAATGLAGTKVKFATTKGDFVIDLHDDKAPISAVNFLKYVNAGFYDGTIFHRVIQGFVIQGGGFKSGLQQPKIAGLDTSPIENEATNGLANVKYSLSLARTSDPNSATSQFFVNLVNNQSLDHVPNDPASYGYAVFGMVIDGQDVVEEIGRVKVGNSGGHRDVPVEDVTITKASVLP